MILLKMTDVSAGYGSTTVVENVSLHLNEHEFVSIIGPSGCGKSSILKVLMGAVTPNAGGVTYKGQAIGANAHPFVFMPQRDALLPWRRIEDNVTLGLEVQGTKPTAARRIAQPLFERFGLEGFQRHYPSQLSGGMRQRAALMRTIVQNKPVQLLDEPFSALDALTRVELQRWLETAWQFEQWSTLLITHDVREAITLSDRIYVLSARPARVIAEIQVPLARPRNGSEFIESASNIEAEILDLLLTQTGIPK